MMYGHPAGNKQTSEEYLGVIYFLEHMEPNVPYPIL